LFIPESIRIGSCDYDVEFTDNPIIVDRKECFASIDYNKHLIQIDKTLGDNQTQEQSFLHEVFHGIARERNLEFEDEELVIDELARGLHRIIRDNPEMFANKPISCIPYDEYLENHKEELCSSHSTVM